MQDGKWDIIALEKLNLDEHLYDEKLSTELTDHSGTLVMNLLLQIRDWRSCYACLKPLSNSSGGMQNQVSHE